MDNISSNWIAIIFTAFGIVLTMAGLYAKGLATAKKDGGNMAIVESDIKFLKESKISDIQFTELKKDLQYLIQDVQSIRKILEDINAEYKDKFRRVYDKIHDEFEDHIRKYHS